MRKDIIEEDLEVSIGCFNIEFTLHNSFNLSVFKSDSKVCFITYFESNEIGSGKAREALQEFKALIKAKYSIFQFFLSASYTEESYENECSVGLDRLSALYQSVGFRPLHRYESQSDFLDMVCQEFPEKILFLDLDGVINTHNGSANSVMANSSYFDRDLVSVLNHILKASNLYVIVSSSWRDDFSDLFTHLNSSGFEDFYRIIGRTEPEDSRELDRGIEINNWIYSNNYSGKYLCVDDHLDSILKHVPENKCLKIETSKGLDFSNSEFIFQYFSE